MIRILKKSAKKLGKLFSNDKKEEKTSEDWVSIKKIKTKKQRRIETRKRKRKRKRISERRRKKNRKR